MNADHKQYIGDSVYAAIPAPGMLCLTTEDGTGISSNTIFLETSVLQGLYRYLDRNAVMLYGPGKSVPPPPAGAE